MEDSDKSRLTPLTFLDWFGVYFVMKYLPQNTEQTSILVHIHV